MIFEVLAYSKRRKVFRLDLSVTARQRYRAFAAGLRGQRLRPPALVVPRISKNQVPRARAFARLLQQRVYIARQRRRRGRRVYQTGSPGQVLFGRAARPISGYRHRRYACGPGGRTYRENLEKKNKTRGTSWKSKKEKKGRVILRFANT